jgi:hypothetical protein
MQVAFHRLRDFCLHFNLLHFVRTDTVRARRSEAGSLFHVNAHEKSEEYLIGTDLRAELPAGLSGGEVSYPKGKLKKFMFSKTPLNIYEGTVTLRMPVTALANAPVGAQKVPLRLRYQACSREICLPPVTLNLEMQLNIVASASGAKPAHENIFRDSPTTH